MFRPVHACTNTDNRVVRTKTSLTNLAEGTLEGRRQRNQCPQTPVYQTSNPLTPPSQKHGLLLHDQSLRARLPRRPQRRAPQQGPRLQRARSQTNLRAPNLGRNGHDRSPPQTNRPLRNGCHRPASCGRCCCQAGVERKRKADHSGSWRGASYHCEGLAELGERWTWNDCW